MDFDLEKVYSMVFSTTRPVVLDGQLDVKKQALHKYILKGRCRTCQMSTQVPIEMVNPVMGGDTDMQKCVLSPRRKNDIRRKAGSVRMIGSRSIASSSRELMYGPLAIRIFAEGWDVLNCRPQGLFTVDRQGVTFEAEKVFKAEVRGQCINIEAFAEVVDVSFF